MRCLHSMAYSEGKWQGGRSREHTMSRKHDSWSPISDSGSPIRDSGGCSASNPQGAGKSSREWRLGVQGRKRGITVGRKEGALYY